MFGAVHGPDDRPGGPVVNVRERLARFRHPSGRPLVDAEAKSILDRVFPPELCDFERGDQWVEKVARVEELRRRQLSEMYEDEGEVA